MIWKWTHSLNTNFWRKSDAIYQSTRILVQYCFPETSGSEITIFNRSRKVPLFTLFSCVTHLEWNRDMTFRTASSCMNSSEMQHKLYRRLNARRFVSTFSPFLQEKQFCTQISFVFHCFLTSYFFHKHINTLSWDLHYGSKCVIFTCSFNIYKELNFSQNVTYDLLAFTWRYRYS